MKTTLSTYLGNVSFSQDISNILINSSEIEQGLLIQLNDIDNIKVGQLI